MQRFTISIDDHHQRDLAERLTALQHEHHPVHVATMHVHLHQDPCMEAVVLRGATAAVQGFADAACAERGVRHGSLDLVSTPLHTQSAHAQGGSRAVHAHVTPHG